MCFNQPYSWVPCIQFLPYNLSYVPLPFIYVFFSLSDSNCCCVYIHRYQTIQWDIGNLPEAISPNKSIVYSPCSSRLLRPSQLEVGLCEPFPLHIEILTDLILSKSCACSHSCCDFKCHVTSCQGPCHIIKPRFFSLLQPLGLTVCTAFFCNDSWVLGKAVLQIYH